MSDTLDKRYMKVASACLAALNSLDTGAKRQQQIQAVYEAIEEAVGDLYRQQQTELKATRSALEKIATLDPSEATLEDAISLARTNLPVRH